MASADTTPLVVIDPEQRTSSSTLASADGDAPNAHALRIERDFGKGAADDTDDDDDLESIGDSHDVAPAVDDSRPTAAAAASHGFGAVGSGARESVGRDVGSMWLSADDNSTFLAMSAVSGSHSTNLPRVPPMDAAPSPQTVLLGAAVTPSQTRSFLGDTAEPQQPSNVDLSKPFRNLIVSGLPRNVDTQQLRGIFDKFGPLITALVMMDVHSGRSRGFGFVWFAVPEDARRALDATNDMPLEAAPDTVRVDESSIALEHLSDEELAALKIKNDGPKRLRVFPSSHADGLTESLTVLFSNWPVALDDNDVRTVLGKFGAVERVDRAPDSGLRSRPVVSIHVTFRSLSDARAAVNQFHGVRAIRAPSGTDVPLPLPLVTKYEVPDSKSAKARAARAQKAAEQQQQQQQQQSQTQVQSQSLNSQSTLAPTAPAPTQVASAASAPAQSAFAPAQSGYALPPGGYTMPPQAAAMYSPQPPHAAQHAMFYMPGGAHYHHHHHHQHQHQHTSQPMAQLVMTPNGPQYVMVQPQAHAYATTPQPYVAQPPMMVMQPSYVPAAGHPHLPSGGFMPPGPTPGRPM